MKKGPDAGASGPLRMVGLFAMRDSVGYGTK